VRFEGFIVIEVYILITWVVRPCGLMHAAGSSSRPWTLECVVTEVILNLHYTATVSKYLISKVIYSPMNEQVNFLKNNIKIYIKIAPTHFGAVTPSSGSSLSVLAKVTFC